MRKASSAPARSTQSSASGLTNEQREELRRRLDNAGLSYRIGRLTRRDFGNRADTFFDYLDSDLSDNDTGNGIGVHLFGNSELRSDCLAILCKGFALGGVSAQYLSLAQLVGILENDTERRKPLVRCDHLFIDWFEKDFRSAEAPYTFYQRAMVEDFLQTRVRGEKVNHYSTAASWDSLKWWSADFTGYTKPYIRSIAI